MVFIEFKHACKHTYVKKGKDRKPAIKRKCMSQISVKKRKEKRTTCLTTRAIGLNNASEILTIGKSLNSDLMPR